MNFSIILNKLYHNIFYNHFYLIYLIQFISSHGEKSDHSAGFANSSAYLPIHVLGLKGGQLG